MTTSIRRAVADFARSSDAGFVLVQLLLSRVVYLVPGLLTAGVIAGKERGSISIAELLGLAPGVVRGLLCNADCGWYENIVQWGYHAGPFAVDTWYNWAFFPLFPVLTILAGGTFIAGIVVSTFAASAACLLVSREVRDRHGRRAARWMVLLLLYWPFSGVLTSYRPEALVLLGAVIAWSAAGRQRWWIAWLGVAIATGARPTGILAAIFVVGEIVRVYRTNVRRYPVALAGSLLPAASMGAFMVFLYAHTGNALAWSDIQVMWGRAFADPRTLAERYLFTPWFIHESWDFTLVNVVVLAVGVLAAIRLWARHDWTMGAYTLASIIVSPITGGLLMSLGRFAATTFPIPLVGATDPRLRHLRTAILVACAVGLALISTWLALGSVAAAA